VPQFFFEKLLKVGRLLLEEFYMGFCGEVERAGGPLKRTGPLLDSGFQERTGVLEASIFLQGFFPGFRRRRLRSLGL